MKVIGYQNYAFNDKDTNKQVTGVTIHCTDPIDSKKGYGEGTFKFSLSDAKVKELPCSLADLVGQEIIIFYNRYGKPDYIEVR